MSLSKSKLANKRNKHRKSRKNKKHDPLKLFRQLADKEIIDGSNVTMAPSKYKDDEVISL